MSRSRVDSEKRIVLLNGRPGDVFEIEQQDEDRLLLVRMPSQAMTLQEYGEAMRKRPLRQTMPWEELRQATREL